jgi:hypothetical protein
VLAVVGRFADRAIILAADELAFGLAGIWKFRLDFIFRHHRPRKLPTLNMPIFYHNHCVSLTRDDKTKLGWRKPRRDFGSIIEPDDSGFGDGEHGHTKSMELFSEMLAGFPWRTVCDPFLGGGGVLLACEEQNRTCIGIEKEPATCAIALERCRQAGLKIKRQ